MPIDGTHARRTLSGMSRSLNDIGSHGDVLEKSGYGNLVVMMNLDSEKHWDREAQRRFWNEWDIRHLQNATLGDDARRRGKAVLSLLEECPLHRPRILELGCGNGWFTEKLVSFGEVTGIDIADEALSEARRRVPGATFYAGDVLSINLPVEEFDVVVTLEMFSHVVSQSLLIELMARVLKREKYLILATQNRTVYMRRHDIVPPEEGQYRHWVTMGELRKKLRLYFRILNASTIQPSGSTGFLHIVNSQKLNGLASKIVPQATLDRLKERCGLGQTLLVLAQKRS